MIKRKGGLWLICYEESGEWIEGSGYFKTSTEAYAAEAETLAKFPPPAVAKPVQTLNNTSVDIKPTTSKVRGQKK